MKTSGVRFVVIALLILGVLGVGLGRLAHKRFAVGDVYPAYSSLRSDPLGLKAFHDALIAVGGAEVTRFFGNYRHFPSGESTTVVFAGVSKSDLVCEREEYDTLDRFLKQGGRLLIALHAEDFNKPDWIFPTNRVSGSGVVPAYEHLDVRWGMPMRGLALEKKDGRYEPVEVVRGKEAAALGIPERLKWFSSGVFSNAAPEWTPILVRGSNMPVLMMRSWGNGTIVAATDSYWLSNEAMRRSREPSLLSWGIGEVRRVVFDETHLGTVEDAGTMTLARRYRLHVFGMVLFLLTGLFIWRSAVSFAPRSPSSVNAGEWVQGQDAAAGFANLLRRTVAPRDLLSICLSEWIKTGRGGRMVKPQRLVEVEAVIQRENARVASGGKLDPVSVYREIGTILKAQTAHGSNSGKVLATVKTDQTPGE